jgi:hypothetical protein
MHPSSYLQPSTQTSGDRSIVPGIVLMVLAVVLTLFFLIAWSGAFESYPYLFLLPWIIGLAVLMAIPIVILYWRGKLSFADPIVFGTISYFFPAFVIGGLFFAAGLSDPYFVSFIQDAEYTLPLTMIVIALGFAGLAGGYFVPLGAKLGGFLETKLPLADYSDRSLIFPGMILLILGAINTIFAFILGFFGYQRLEESSQYEGLIYLTTLLWMQGSFLLWLLIFRQKKFSIILVPALALLVITSLSKIVFGGGRSGFLQICVIVFLAWFLSGRVAKFRHAVVGTGILLLSLLLGMIYGTTFRNVKGTESKESAEEYTEKIFRTVDEIGRSDVAETMQFGFASLAERVDIVSTLAVVVSNYEALAPYEEAYGLNENIWTDATTFFIPRIIWKDKPAASDPRKYSELYFNFGETSFAITPMGDLLRNYGLVGIPIGMFVLGFLLRIVYTALVEGKSRIVWRITLYFMLLTSVSYEGFYGTIIPHFFKVAVTATVGILLVSVIAKKMDSGRRVPTRLLLR